MPKAVRALGDRAPFRSCVRRRGIRAREAAGRRGRGATARSPPPGRQPCFSSALISPKVRSWPVGQEHRVVAEAAVAARRPDERAVDAARESLDRRRPGRAERQHADEMRAALLRRRRAGAPGAASSTLRMAAAKSLAGPAQRAE